MYKSLLLEEKAAKRSEVGCGVSTVRIRRRFAVVVLLAAHHISQLALTASPQGEAISGYLW